MKKVYSNLFLSKKYICLLIIIISSNTLSAQTKISLEVRRHYSTDFFNGHSLWEGQKKPWQPPLFYEPYSTKFKLYGWPQWALHLSGSKWDLELYRGHYQFVYYSGNAGFHYQYGSIERDEIESANSTNYSLVIHRRVLNEKYLQGYLGLGINYVRYGYTTFLGFWGSSDEPAYGGGIQKLLGPQFQLKLRAPIYKGLYTTANAFVYYTPRGERMRGQYVADFGLGYALFDGKNRKRNKN